MMPVIYPIRQGVHSIPAIHTTHKHIEGFYPRYEESLRKSWRYVIGQDKPNYPVPAPLIEYDMARGNMEQVNDQTHDDCQVSFRRLSFTY